MLGGYAESLVEAFKRSRKWSGFPPAAFVEFYDEFTGRIALLQDAGEFFGFGGLGLDRECEAGEEGCQEDGDCPSSLW